MLPRLPSRTPSTAPRPPWPVAAFALLTLLSAAAVGLTASDTFTRMTMAAAVIACIGLRQTLHDPVVTTGLTTIVMGAVLGWGLDFYDRIWWYDDLAHFLFSLVGTMAVARLVLHRFDARPAVALPIALWLAWQGIGALWEIGEWTSDRLQATAHSRGYVDTMTDMILNSTGSGLGAAAYWRWLRQPAATSTTTRPRT